MKCDKFTFIWNRVKMVSPPSSKAPWWFWAMSWIIWIFSLKHYWKLHNPGRGLHPCSRSPEGNQVPYGLREVCSPSFRVGGPGILSVLNPGWAALEGGLCYVDFTDRPLLLLPPGPSMSLLPLGVVPCGSPWPPPQTPFWTKRAALVLHGGPWAPSWQSPNGLLRASHWAACSQAQSPSAGAFPPMCSTQGVRRGGSAQGTERLRTVRALISKSIFKDPVSGCCFPMHLDSSQAWDNKRQFIILRPLFLKWGWENSWLLGLL